MLSERLRNFLGSWCNLDADPEEAAAMLHGPDGLYYRGWLSGELAAAIQGHEITPAVATDLTTIYFEDQQAVDDWLRMRWSLWFAEPYPGG
jgi:hypothetical protein